MNTMPTATRERIAKAVANRDWQRFRRQLKGLSTQEKIDKLKSYHRAGGHTFVSAEDPRHARMQCSVCIRVDNYIKALCRGGQLEPGQSIHTALDDDWKMRIKK